MVGGKANGSTEKGRKKMVRREGIVKGGIGSQ